MKSMAQTIVDRETMARDRDPDREWVARTVRDAPTFGSLADEWRDLHENCAVATPFQSHEWLNSWWRSYGGPDNLRVVILRRDGRLVGAAPLMKGRRWGIPVLHPIARGLSDFTDFLVRDGEAPQTVHRLVRALLAEAGGGVIDLPDVPPRAVARRIAEVWPAPTWRTTSSVCFELPGQPVEALVKTLPKDQSKRLRNKLHQIDKSGLADRTIPAGEAPAAIDTMLRLHELQWRGRGIDPEHVRPRFADHLTRAASAMVADGQAVLVEWRLDGRILAVELLIVGHQFVGGYLYGAHPDLRFVDVTSLLMRGRLALTHRLGRPVYSMLRGAESHKMHFSPRAVPNDRLLLGGTGRWPARAYAAGVVGRQRAVRMLRERYPSVGDALRRARAKVLDRRARRLNAQPR